MGAAMDTLQRPIPDPYEEGKTLWIDTYKPEHWPENQARMVEGFPVNPCMRIDFDRTPNNCRESLEIEHWKGLPYIIEDCWDNAEEHMRNTQAYHREQQDAGVITDTELETWIDAEKTKWFNRYPTGYCYTIRCLDGDAWDRGTYWGDTGSLDEAISICKDGPKWRR